MNGANQDRGQNEKLGVICSVFRTIMDLLCTDLPVQSLLLELVMFAHPQQLVGTCPGSDSVCPSSTVSPFQLFHSSAFLSVLFHARLPSLTSFSAHLITS